MNIRPIYIILFCIVGIPALGLLGFFLLGPSYVRKLNLERCEANLKTIHIAIEGYRKDKGKYPASFADLTSESHYLSPQTGCPGADLRDTYSASYQRSTDGLHYKVFCQGHYHPALAENQPALDETGKISTLSR